jgi:hypothetical protein
MTVRVLRGRPRDLEALRGQWATERDRAAAGVAGTDASGEWLAVLIDPVGDPTGAFAGPEVTWFDSDDVQQVLAGSPAPGAEFIQIMTARVDDRDAWAAADRQAVPRFATIRPDFLGALRVWQGDLLTVVDSYRSEAEARAGEARGHSAKDQALFDAWFARLSNVRWHDLIPPW